MSDQQLAPVATQQPGNPMAPFTAGRALALHVNQGAVAIESERAVAEARGQMQLAKMFPRDLNQVMLEVTHACKLSAMADVAFYTVKQGGSNVTGASIRLAEQLATSLGNIEWGHRELSRQEGTDTNFGRSEIEVYAWDKEKNVRSTRQITVLHVIDTREGPRRLRDQRDIDNKIANVASKQMRGRLLALLPKWLVEMATQECRKTIAGDNDVPLEQRVRTMVQAFDKFGVKINLLEAFIGKPLKDIIPDDLVDLQGAYSRLKEGASVQEIFTDENEGQALAAAAAAKPSALAAAVQQNAKPEQATQQAPDAETKAGKPAINKGQPKTQKESTAPVQTQAEQGKTAQARVTELTPDPQSDGDGDGNWF